jgi:hypothetical protein
MNTRHCLSLVAAIGLAGVMTGQAGEQTLPPYVNGTVTADLTIHLITPLPPGDSLNCNLTISTTDNPVGTPQYATVFSDSQLGVEATVSGSTATCKMDLPYEWTLSEPGSDLLAVTYSLAFVNTGPVRTATHPFPVIAMPGNDTVTHLSVDTKL